MLDTPPIDLPNSTEVQTIVFDQKDLLKLYVHLLNVQHVRMMPALFMMVGMLSMCVYLMMGEILGKF